ncbi:MAG: hypothetical protein ACHP6I_01085 [Rickettsiales bacterium]
MKRTLSLLTMFLAGCTCHSPEIKVFEGYDAELKHLSCQQLEFAMSEAIYIMRSLDRKDEHITSYARYPQCIIATQMKVARATEAAKDRLDFLDTIYAEKKCSAAPVASKPVKTPGTDDKYVNAPLPIEK